MEKLIGIYKITNLKTNQNYIGQSTNIKERFKHYRLLQCSGQPVLFKSLTEYGYNNHSFDIIESIIESDPEIVKTKLHERELYWSEIFNAFVDNGGLVSRVGGRHGYMSEECKGRMSESKKGDNHFYRKNPRKESSIRKQAESIVKYKDNVVAYNLDGTYIKTYKHASDARFELNIKCCTNDIFNNCKGKQLKCKGYIFQFENNNNIETILERLKTEKYRNNIQKIYQYSLEDKFIKDWDSSYDIEKNNPLLRATDIRSCCRGKQKTAYGHKWSYISPKHMMPLELQQFFQKNEYSYREKIIPAKFFLTKTKEELETYVEPLTEWLMNYQPEFPFDKIKAGEKQYTEIINSIQKYDLDSIFQEGNIVKNATSSVGIFFLKSRFLSYWKSSYNKRSTPFDIWKDRKAIRNIIHYRIGINDIRETFEFSLHQIIRGMSAIRNTISFFKPIVAAAIYKHFLKGIENPTVIDPCAGFGGRLLAFKSIYPNGTYIGIEPNPETYNELQQLVEECKFTNVLLYNCKAEDYTGTKECDLTFTSIPYFDKEIYSHDIVSDSYVNINDWQQKFINNGIMTYKNLLINLPKDLEYLFNNIKETYLFKNNSATHMNKQKEAKYELLLKF